MSGLAGCGNDGDEREAERTVTRLLAAVEARDGRAACRELTEETRSSLESASGSACDKAVLELDVEAGEVLDTSVSVVSAIVTASGGQSYFLDDTPSGWKVSALGCTPRAERPYDCEVEG
jgi:hypothetical protein